MQAMAKNTIEKAIYNRTELLLGDDVMEALAAVRVIIFGVGGSRELVCGGTGAQRDHETDDRGLGQDLHH